MRWFGWLFRRRHVPIDLTGCNQPKTLLGTTLLRHCVKLFLLDHPGCTSRELANYLGEDKYAVARELSRLQDEGFAYRSKDLRKCTVTGRRCRTWHPV